MKKNKKKLSGLTLEANKPIKVDFTLSKLEYVNRLLSEGNLEDAENAAKQIENSGTKLSDVFNAYLEKNDFRRAEIALNVASVLYSTACYYLGVFHVTGVAEAGFDYDIAERHFGHAALGGCVKGAYWVAMLHKYGFVKNADQSIASDFLNYVRKNDPDGEIEREEEEHFKQIMF